MKIYKINRLLLVPYNNDFAKELISKENKIKSTSKTQLRSIDYFSTNNSITDKRFEIKSGWKKIQLVQDKFGVGLIPSYDDLLSDDYADYSKEKETYTFYTITNSTLYFDSKLLEDEDFFHEEHQLGFVITNENTNIQFKGYKKLNIPKGVYEIHYPCIGYEEYEFFSKHNP